MLGLKKPNFVSQLIHRADHLAGNGRDHDHFRLPGCEQMAVSLAHSKLTLPGDVAHHVGEPLDPVVKLATDARLHAVAPCALDQGTSRQSAADLCDPAPAHSVATGMFRWCQPEIGHQLTRVVETIKISDLGHYCDGDDECDPTHSLDRFDNWRQ